MNDTNLRLYSFPIKLLFIASLVLVFLFSPLSTFAASTLFWGDFDNDDFVSITNGDIQAVPLNVSHEAFLVPDDPQIFAAEGALFFIPDSNSPTRQHVTDFGGFFGPDEITWSQAGVYEVDVYELGAPVPVHAPFLQRIFAWFFATPVYAQPTGPFIETIRFTIVDASVPQYQECCSSVIFLPGFEGSILKTDSGTNTLWPPTFGEVSDDLQRLQIASNGVAIDQNIVVDGVLENFSFGIFSEPIYRDFVLYMDTLVANTADGIEIKEWKSLPYDWRFSPEEIILNGVQTPNALVDVLAMIEQTALDSNTGQVTLIGHSMGGLMGKAIIKELESRGKADLIDSFVMVGTPQLGTPQAATALLHGEGAEIGQWPVIIVDKEAARSLAYNMQSAYNLLPSEEYFNRVIDPVATFDPDTPLTQVWIDFWGLALGNFSEYFYFLVGNGPNRTRPASGDTQQPEVLRSDLVQNALDLHTELDNYDFPSNIRVVQVAGWGLQTIKGIEYTEDQGELDYEPKHTIEGDKTVVYPSSLASNVSDSRFVHLSNYNRSTSSNSQHRNLVGATPILEIIENVIAENVIGGITFVTKTKPAVSEVEDALLVSVHSPVTLGVYDGLGNFTGIAPGQNSSADILFVQEDIPGSTYQQIGKGKYVILPKDGSYSFVFQGTNSGTATIKVAQIQNDTATTTSIFSNIPITLKTQAQLVLDSNTEVPKIELDQDDDGEVDQIVSPDGTELSLNEVIGVLKEKINGLDIKEKLKKKLLKKVEKLEKRIEKKKQKNKKLLEKLEKKIIKKNVKGKISYADTAELIELLDMLGAQSDEITLAPAIIDNLHQKIENLDINFGLKRSLLNKLNKLEKRNAILKHLSNFTRALIRKGERGKIDEVDVQEIINLLGQIENQL